MKADHFDHMLEGLQALNMEDGVKLLKRWYLKAQLLCHVMNNAFNWRIAHSHYSAWLTKH